MGLKDWKGMLPLIGSRGMKVLIWRENEETLIRENMLQIVQRLNSCVYANTRERTHACANFSRYTKKLLKLSLLKNLSTTTSGFNSTSAMSQTSLLFFSLSLALSVSLTHCCSNRPGQLLFQKADEIVPWSTAGTLDLTLKSDPTVEMFAYRL